MCADRGFSSVEIAEDLYNKDLTYVGTIMRNRVVLPTPLKNVKGRAKESSEIFLEEGFNPNSNFLPSKKI